jgi:group I intron endonuclease
MTVGIYIIRNKLNGKVYVGSSINVEQRWRQHKGLLRKNEHHSPTLQNAWNKYGEEVFEFVIAEEVLNVEELAETEQRFIDRHEAYKSTKGYNIRAIVDRVSSFVFKDRQRQAEEKALAKLLKVQESKERTVRITFQGTVDDLEYIKVQAARARLSQSEFLRKLIHEYGDQLVAKERESRIDNTSKN